jgi:glycosyltransferase involved in cell wall biosynthesis
MAEHRRQPYVLQTHGMVTPKKSPLHNAVDRLATLRVLRHAGAVFSLSPQESDDLAAVLGSERRIDLLPNGIAPLPARRASEKLACGREFLFLARLHPRKRASIFVDAAIRMLTAGSTASFTLIGPDEGEAPAVEARISEFAEKHPDHVGALRWLGPVAPQETSVRMENAYAYVLPSVNEPFPMSVIEALAAGLPVVITESNGLADVVKQYDCGIVIADDSVEALGDAMQQLLAFPDQVARMGQQATVAVRDEFSIETVTERLEQRYREIARQPQKEGHSQ